ncbi:MULTISPECIES: alpha/beta fold hydrolase [Bacillaceae]|uniref:alpha/beta fold hydrolase n=1 Tax=Bacillaceae TaxID=186817 RepID=UPI001E55B20C|nr:alpha/beta fold hydrolase [Bacillus sp. Au-Bac7]MCE4049251.1 alpha/beta hydrolase [Bacillus sp. Au-Bac7]
MKKIFNKKVLLSLLIVILLAVSAFFVWTQITYEAIDDPAIKMDNKYSKDGDWLIYGDKDSTTGIILYPGAKVEPEAYGYLAQELAKNNMLVAIPNVTLNLPIFDYSKADELIGEYKGVENWILGGHSMGGAAAAMYADKNIDKVQGLVLLGSYAAENETLSSSSLPVLSISGSEDGLSTQAKIKENKPYLPDTAEYVEIAGGNHAQFGVYGEQSGDNEAKISVKEQQDSIVDNIEKWAEEHNWTK